MTLTKKIVLAAIISLVFLSEHLLVLTLGFTGSAAFLLIVIAMGINDVAAFFFLRRGSAQMPGFIQILSMLCLVQLFSIVVLTVFSAARQPDKFAINPAELVTSLLLFAGFLPLLVSAVLWFTVASKKTK